MTVNQTDSDFVIEDSFTSLKATSHGSAKWAMFLPSLVTFLAQAFCFLPVVGLGLSSYVQKNFSEAIQSMIWLFALVVVGLFLYRELLEIAEYAYTEEVILIDEHSITVEKSGFLFLKTRKIFPAENVRGILSSSFVREQFNPLRRLPFASSGFGAFMIYQDRLWKPFYTFGKSISKREAESFLESVYRKFPKYRYTDKT